MEKKVIAAGKDYTDVLPMFRELILKSGINEEENLVFAGCPGPCYAMATFLSSVLTDMHLNLYFAVDSDIRQVWRLEHREHLGIVATAKEVPIKAKVIVLMSALCTLPIEQTLGFIRGALANDGIIIGEAPAPGLFDGQGWDEQIPFHYLFEFSMKNPCSFEVRSVT